MTITRRRVLTPSLAVAWPVAGLLICLMMVLFCTSVITGGTATNQNPNPKPEQTRFVLSTPSPHGAVESLEFTNDPNTDEGNYELFAGGEDLILYRFRSKENIKEIDRIYYPLETVNEKATRELLNNGVGFSLSISSSNVWLGVTDVPEGFQGSFNKFQDNKAIVKISRTNMIASTVPTGTTLRVHGSCELPDGSLALINERGQLLVGDITVSLDSKLVMSRFPVASLALSTDRRTLFGLVSVSKPDQDASAQLIWFQFDLATKRLSRKVALANELVTTGSIDNTGIACFATLASQGVYVTDEVQVTKKIGDLPPATVPFGIRYSKKRQIVWVGGNSATNANARGLMAFDANGSARPKIWKRTRGASAVALSANEDLIAFATQQGGVEVHQCERLLEGRDEAIQSTQSGLKVLKLGFSSTGSVLLASELDTDVSQISFDLNSLSTQLVSSKLESGYTDGKFLTSSAGFKLSKNDRDYEFSFPNAWNNDSRNLSDLRLTNDLKFVLCQRRDSLLLFPRRGTLFSSPFLLVIPNLDIIGSAYDPQRGWVAALTKDQVVHLWKVDQLEGRADPRMPTVTPILPQLSMFVGAESQPGAGRDLAVWNMETGINATQGAASDWVGFVVTRGGEARFKSVSDFNPQLSNRNAILEIYRTGNTQAAFEVLKRESQTVSAAQASAETNAVTSTKIKIIGVEGAKQVSGETPPKYETTEEKVVLRVQVDEGVDRETLELSRLLRKDAVVIPFDDESIAKLPVTLRDGVNDIEVSATFNGVQIRDKIEVVYVPSKPRPVTWKMLVLTIAKYDQSNVYQELSPNRGDAQVMNDMFKSLDGRIGKVEVQTVDPDGMTRAKVLETLKSFRAQVGDTDRAMVYISAHGDLDSGLPTEKTDYYLICKDTMKENLKNTAISWKEVKQILERPADPMILFLDACHSGGAVSRDERESDNFVKYTLKQGQMFILTSSSPSQVSFGITNAYLAQKPELKTDFGIDREMSLFAGILRYTINQEIKKGKSIPIVNLLNSLRSNYQKVFEDVIQKNRNETCLIESFPESQEKWNKFELIPAVAP